MTKPETPAAGAATGDSASVTLDTPIKRGDTAITVVQLRKPKTGELRGLLLTDLLQMRVDALAALLPRISAPTLTRPEIDALDAADLVALGTAAVGFFLTKEQRAQAAAPAASSEYPSA